MIKRILCLLLCLCLALSLPLTALAEQRNTIHIRTVKDLLQLAQDCMLDRYSQGKTVYLQEDLDLTGVAFTGIPTFGGTFEGQGHAISGLELTGAGSAAGLFRYVQPGAVVRQLTVSGRVAPGGSAASSGGIVGVNRGLLSDCRFEGSVAGSSGVGGIVGVNEAGGCILRCVSQGVVVGENMTGGIVGYNMGLVDGCENQSGVNIHTPDSTVDLSAIDLSLLMDPSALSAHITVMDTGGIAGYSIGSIYDCTNAASVGYPRIGYNVGGIVGRSSGIVAGCANRAAVQGRKDVGGIVGQMEPNVSVNLDEDYLQQLEDQFATLEDLIRQLQGSMDLMGATGTHLNNTVDYIDDASASLELLTGYLGTYGTDLTNEFNRASLLLQDAINQLLPVLDQATVVSQSVETAITTMAAAMAALGDSADYLSSAMTRMNAALTNLKEAGSQTSKAMELVLEGVKQLASALQIKDQQKAALALEQIETGLQQLSEASSGAGEAMRKIAEILQQEGNWDEDTEAAFSDAFLALADMGDALQTIADGVTLLLENVEFDLDSLREGMESIAAGGACLVKVMDNLQKAADHISLAMESLNGAIGLGGYAMDTLATGMRQLATSVSNVTTLTQLLDTAMTNISQYAPIQLPQLNSAAEEETGKLFDSVNGISDELRSILTLSDTFSQEVKGQLNGIYDTFQQILQTAMKLSGQVLDTTAGGIIKDTSDADIDAVKAGKVSDCVNEGSIAGDLNAGGIAGAMGIDYQLDPEDDLTEQLSEHRLRSYQAKAIIQDCMNQGVIDGKRSNIGGICGRMDMGVIFQTGNFGNVSSESGDYVGGIAGSSMGVIRSCGVKADLAGGKYVGGVAGYAAAVVDCRAMVQLTGLEFVGCILGDAENTALEEITANFYFALTDDPGAIDGICYNSHAQGATWDVFLDSPVTGQRFAQAELTFRFADGTIQVLRLPVGTELEAGMVPALENSDKQIHFWEGLADQLDQPQYFDRIFTETSKNRISVLESAETRPNGKPILLLQGSFLEQESVQLLPLANHPQTLEGWQYVTPAGGTTTQIRCALPEGIEDGVILVRDPEGNLQQVPSTRIGSYLAFSLDEGVTAFYVAAVPESNGWIWYAVIAAGVLALLATIVIVRTKKKKTSK